jgi:signal transduction histidine kinase
MRTAAIDWFTPAGRPMATRELTRHRKLVAFLLVLFAVTAVTATIQAVQGAQSAALVTGFMTVVVTAALVSLRLGATAWLVTSVVLFAGVLSAATMALGDRSNGVGALFWVTLTPLMALAVGGSRSGWVTLASSGLVICVTLVGIDQEWLEPVLNLERPLASRLTSLFGVMLTAFLLTRAYELETEASIVALERQNEALLQARNDAARASQAKSQFIATISHEIRTPLNGVTGMVALLNDEPDQSERTKEGLRVIQQSADALLAVISDVLDFSKIESSHLELERVPLCVSRELRSVVDLFQSRAAEQGNDLELFIEPNVPEWIAGDPTRLRQIVMNLVANAVKFTTKGRVSVRCTATPGQLVIEVHDTGIGMSTLVTERLFQPFAQADASTTRRFGGTGLGLAISRRLAEAMGGTLTAESEPGRGSAFFVRIPFEVAQPIASAPTPLQVVRTPRSVLVVEDNFVNQLVVVRLLQKLGHQVMVAQNGEEGIARGTSEAFDLVLMDCHMPVMDGFEATRRLRSNGVTTPIFALTAAVTNEDRDECLRAGMTGVLSKPLRVERLSEVLDSLPV